MAVRATDRQKQKPTNHATNMAVVVEGHVLGKDRLDVFGEM